MMSVQLKSSSTTLQKQYKLGLFDLDGVVYRGPEPVENAAQALTAAAQEGMLVTYTTNNPSRFPQTVADQVASFGVECKPEQIITSAIVASRMLAHRVSPGAKVLVVGGEHLKTEIASQGFQVVDSADEKPEAAIMGWFPHISWQELAQMCFAVEQGTQFYATNLDLTLPREKGVTPGIGSFVQAVGNATGQKPLAIAGKPESAMYDVEREIYAGNAPLVPIEQCLPVGDRLDTDIEAANRGGYDSLCVLTGVTQAEQLIFAEPLLRPTFISQDLRGLGEVHQAPVVAHGEGEREHLLYSRTLQSCAVYDAEQQEIRVENFDSRSVDQLRCVCQLAWYLADEQEDLSQLSLPEFKL